MPRRVMPAASAPPNALDFRAWAESDFLAAFLRLVSRVGEETAWQIYDKLSKGKRGRPSGPTRPERDEEVRRLLIALGPMRTAEAARLIHGAFAEYRATTPKAVEMRIRRLNGGNT